VSDEFERGYEEKAIAELRFYPESSLDKLKEITTNFSQAGLIALILNTSYCSQ
jgi:hypothetical protein